MKMLALFCCMGLFSFKVYASEFELGEQKVIRDLALDAAVCTGDVEGARRVLQQPGELTAISLATPALQGNFDMIRFLVEEAHVDVDTQDLQGRTGLYAACFSGFNNIAEYLIQKKADPFIAVSVPNNVLHRAGDTALHAACKNQKCSPDIIQKLLNEADLRRRARHFVNTTNSDGESCLHNLLDRPDFDDDLLKILREILDRKADANLQDQKGASPLHKACGPKSSPTQQMAALTLLMQRGANPEIADRGGKKAQNRALDRGIILDVTNHQAFDSRSSDARRALVAIKMKAKLTPAPAFAGDVDCAICLEVITDEYDATTLPCHHTFHKSSCLSKWFNKLDLDRKNHSCPLCRSTNVGL